MNKISVCLAALALIAACEEEPKPEWGDDVDHNLGFTPAAQCPAPGTPQATSYQENGGSTNALLWWMTFHALNSGSPVEHHYHHYTNPTHHVQRAVVRSVFNSTSAPARTVSAPSPAVRVKTSPNYGYKAPAAPRPSSTTTFRSFRSSSPSRSYSSPSRSSGRR